MYCITPIIFFQEPFYPNNIFKVTHHCFKPIKVLTVSIFCGSLKMIGAKANENKKRYTKKY